MTGLRRFIGIPYRNKGRDFDGCDCWGLVDLYHREVLGIELPNYLGGYRDAAETAIVEKAILRGRTAWTLVGHSPGRESPPGAVALFKIRGRASHVGLVIDGTKLLHTLGGRNSSLEDLDALTWRDRLLGVWTWNT